MGEGAAQAGTFPAPDSFMESKMKTKTNLLIFFSFFVGGLAWGFLPLDRLWQPTPVTQQDPAETKEQINTELGTFARLAHELKPSVIRCVSREILLDHSSGIKDASEFRLPPRPRGYYGSRRERSRVAAGEAAIPASPGQALDISWPGPGRFFWGRGGKSEWNAGESGVSTGYGVGALGGVVAGQVSSTSQGSSPSCW